jgi:osmoprotectant transport system ATP-binding protein
MDEPFGALDPITRDVLQSELKELNKSLRKTIVFITHDMDEALKLADRVVLMRQGKIEQMGSPEEIQNAPANDFVRSFIGEDRLASISPESSLETLLHDPFLRVTPGEDPRDVLERMEDDGLETAQVVDARGNWVGHALSARAQADAQEQGNSPGGGAAQPKARP